MNVLVWECWVPDLTLDYADDFTVALAEYLSAMGEERSA